MSVVGPFSFELNECNEWMNEWMNQYRLVNVRRMDLWFNGLKRPIENRWFLQPQKYIIYYVCTNIKGGMIIWKIDGCIDWEILKVIYEFSSYNLKTIQFFHFLTKIKGGTHQCAEISKVFYQSLETTKSYLDRKFLCGIFRTNWLTDGRTSSNP